MSLRMARVQVRMAPSFRKQSQARQSSRSRQKDVEGRAVSGLALDGDGAVMLQDDAPRDGQSEASAFGFGGEEGLEQARQVSRRNAGTVVLHSSPEAGPVGRNSLRGDRERALRPHRVQGVEEEVHKRLL